ncbi:autophagy-related protein 8i [Gossypium australe]|uniref:Autophagy-related protein n=1 Tax=Gossypium australe TaxID=47621 RepID=A0A5B6V0W0_9ROSI|nr:autophagy-related protein 8i [Gossypium australe]
MGLEKRNNLSCYIYNVEAFVVCFVPERMQAEAARIREKYPDRIPVIVERADKSDMPDIDKKKSVILSLLVLMWAWVLTNVDKYFLVKKVI